MAKIIKENINKISGGRDLEPSDPFYIPQKTVDFLREIHIIYCPKEISNREIKQLVKENYEFAVLFAMKRFNWSREVAEKVCDEVKG